MPSPLAGFSLAFASVVPALAACDPDASIIDVGIGGGWSSSPLAVALSSDGRYVAFGIGSTPYVYRYDRQTCQTVLITVASDNVSLATGHVYEHFISGDGNLVSFFSADQNMVAGDTNDDWDIFVRDVALSQTIRASVDSSNAQANDGSGPAAMISTDGQIVIFASSATNLVNNDTNGITDIFARNLTTGQTTLVSVDSNGVQANAYSSIIDLSADGRYILFQSRATNLVANDTNAADDAFLRDLQTNETIRVSLGVNGTQPNADSWSIAISGDGRFVLFGSHATNLLSDESTCGIYISDTITGLTSCATLPSEGAFQIADISANGRYMTFTSDVNELVPGDTNNKSDVFVRDLLTGDTIRITSGINNAPDLGYYSAISEDGQYVAFNSSVDGIHQHVFLAKVTYPPPPATLVVTSTNDQDDGVCTTGHCSLREAINAANEFSDTNTITFNISDGGSHTIQPFTPLPLITNPVIIDGTTQPGYVAGSPPVIALNGANAVSGAPSPHIDLVGINIFNASNVTVRGLILNGWGYGGIGILNGSNNVIEGNFIGTNAAGTAAVPNLYGVIIYNGSNNRVGGTTPAQRNVIAGNNDDGVNIGGATSAQAVANLVQGNYIGTNAAGTAALGNGDDGVKVEIADGTIIGGTTAAARNIIAASVNNGVILKGVGTINSLVQGNYVGTDVTGTAALGNGLAGVRIEDAPNNTVGGIVVGARNIISGNQYGVFVDSASTGNSVQGNYIGTDAAGTIGLGLQSAGVTLSGNNNILGGTIPGARNIISGNVVGLGILGNGNVVQGNYIGTDVTGTQDIGNTAWGIEVVATAANNTIGGTVAGAGNLIAYNGSNGIVLHGATVGTGNAILGNSIFSNGILGIDLSSDPVGGGVTPNDPGDPDTGPNNLQNFPVLTAANLVTNGTALVGTLNSEASKTYRLEFFASPMCDSQYYREGKIYLGFTSVTTDGSGNASFTVNMAAVSMGKFITATATDPSYNTSEFSACVPVVAISAPAAAPTLYYYRTTSVPLSWTGVTWATGYEIQVDDNADFMTLAYSSSLGADVRSDTASLPSVNTVYYWRVGAKKAGGGIVWSAPQKFAVVVP